MLPGRYRHAQPLDGSGQRPEDGHFVTADGGQRCREFQDQHTLANTVVEQLQDGLPVLAGPAQTRRLTIDGRFLNRQALKGKGQHLPTFLELHERDPGRNQ